MKSFLIASLICAFASLPALAADASAAPAKPKTAQQQKMADCSTKAKGLKGAEYKKSVSACLKGDAAAATPAAADPAADKTAACEAAAVSKTGKPLAGAAKKSSVQACLKKAA